MTACFVDTARFLENPSLGERVRYGVHSTVQWFANFVEFFHRRENARTLCVSGQAGDLIGALPLELQQARGTRFWNLRRLVPLGHGISDFHPVLCQSGREVEVARALAGWFRRNPNRWDSLNLDLIPESSSGWREFVEEMKTAGFSPRVTHERSFYKINTDADWKAYEKIFLHPKLADLRNRKNRLARDGIQAEVKLVERDIINFLDGFLSTYRQRRQAAHQPNVFDTHPAMRPFLEAVIRDYETRGWVRLSLLVSGETILAYQLDWIHNGVWYHYMPAFRERFAEYSPGKILLYETIKMAFADPSIHEFNFMRGESTYKTQFASESESFISITLENPHSLRLKATRLASKLTDWRDRLRT